MSDFESVVVDNQYGVSVGLVLTELCIDVLSLRDVKRAVGELECDFVPACVAQPVDVDVVLVFLFVAAAEYKRREAQEQND